MWVQSWEGLVEWEQDCILSAQTWRWVWTIEEAATCLSMEEMKGSDGSWERSWSRSRVRARESGDKPGVKFGTLPRGMYFLDEFRRMRRKMGSPDPHERCGSSPNWENCSSVSRVKFSQSAFLKLVKVWDVGGENAPETDDDGEVVRVEGFDGGPVQVQGEVGGGERDVRGGWGAMGGKTSG